MSVVVRFAPSPTGALHLGGARTALFNYLFAKQHGGEFLLRIEDTDRARSRPEFEQDILDGLKWLGLTHDGLEKQSARGDIYRNQINRLIQADRAYLAPDQVIRFKNPGQVIKFHDLIRGEIAFDTTELGDFVIAKSETEPIYHLAAVVDDIEMKITHVIRGEDHISNTPRQILILEALEAARPIYAHIPLILATDRSKLSKRHGAVALNDYRAMGYLPEALNNYLALLGWHPAGDRELFSLADLVQHFSLERIQRGGAVFDQAKLDWLNREYLRHLPVEEFLHQLAIFGGDSLKELVGEKSGQLRQLVPTLRERLTILSDIKNLLEDRELDYFFRTPEYDPSLLESTINLPAVGVVLESLSVANFTPAAIKEAVWPLALGRGKAAVLGSFRLALAGRIRSADPFTIAAVIGREETLRRLRHAVETKTN